MSADFAGRIAVRGPLRIGVLRLTDSAPVIVAHEFGFFAEEGIETMLHVEPSWANIADKLAYGALDAAVMLPPLALAMTLGLRGPAEPLIIPYCISLGGNALTLRKDLVPTARPNLEGVVGTLRDLGEKAVLGVVHDHSPHNLLLRYWLATAGAVAGRDYRIAVVPPALTLDALQSGRIAGFCAGAPWGEVAARSGVGFELARSDDFWRNSPEKCLAVRSAVALNAPDRLDGLLRALYLAARFCDAPENSTYVASLLSRRAHLDVDSHAILSSLPGGPGGRSHSRFLAHAATFPWRSHALWFLTQMRRWGLLPAEANLQSAAKIYRPDLYARALKPLSVPIPLDDAKLEGAHLQTWSAPAAPVAIPMFPDAFCDGAIFNPDAIA